MIRLLDGGMGQELRRRSATPDHPLWGAKQMLDEPGLVRALHEEFLRAGAQIITTNTFGTSRWRLNRHGMWDAFAAANRAAGEAAEAAREAVNPAALIAGSLPPLRSAYRADLVLPVADAVVEYAEQALVLAPHVDVFLAETMVSALEARGAAEAALAAGKPVWVAFTLHDYGPPRLRGGETIAEAVGALADLSIGAFLLNCSTPEVVSAGMAELVAAAGATPAGGYANGFVEVPQEWALGMDVDELMLRADLDPDAYAAHASAWLDAGATIVGGCCEVGPAHIARLAALIATR